jgi:hypothetical protein
MLGVLSIEETRPILSRSSRPNGDLGRRRRLVTGVLLGLSPKRRGPVSKPLRCNDNNNAMSSSKRSTMQVQEPGFSRHLGE